MRNKILYAMIGIASFAQCSASNTDSLLDPVKFGTLTETDQHLTLLDVRNPEEFHEGYIPGAINVDFQNPDFLNLAKQAVASGNDIALYCRSGHRSASAAEILEKNGYSVTDLKGGFLAWQEDRLPLTTGATDKYLTPQGSTVTIEPLIHASLRITLGDYEIEIDPVGQLGDRVTDYASFPKADIILVTHEHHDHFDPKAIETLSGQNTRVILNEATAKLLGHGEVMHNGDKLTINEHLTIESVPAYNTTPCREQFHPKGRDNGYILTLYVLRIYIAGDTEVILEMNQIKDIDVAFLPCNQPYTMTPPQFIEAAKIINPRVVYPYHFGDTDLSAITPALAPEGIYVRIFPFH